MAALNTQYPALTTFPILLAGDAKGSLGSEGNDPAPTRSTSCPWASKVVDPGSGPASSEKEPYISLSWHEIEITRLREQLEVANEVRILTVAVTLLPQRAILAPWRSFRRPSQHHKCCAPDSPRHIFSQPSTGEFHI